MSRPAFVVAALAIAVATVGAAAAPASAYAAQVCDITGATLDWGFKESFRSYIDGSIANGEWTTADGAGYDTPVFTFADGTGTFTPLSGDGDIAFGGSVHFTGHGGVLDVTIANPRVELRSGRSATLYLDVDETSMDGVPISAEGSAFVDADTIALDLQDGGDGRLVVTADETVLSETGTAAFPDYPAGEAFDGFTLTLPPVEGCAFDASDQPSDAEPVGGEGAPLALVIGVALLTVGVGTAVIVQRRRREQREARDDA